MEWGKNINIILIFFYVILFSMQSIYSFGNENDPKPLCDLIFKRVLTEKTSDGPLDQYEYGKNNYPDNSYNRLPDDFLISKEPDLVIKPNEIESVEIQKIKVLKFLNYKISIRFSSDAANSLYLLTNRMVGKQLAMEIDGEIMYTGNVMEPINNSISFTILDNRFQRIYNQLCKITKDVKINPEERTVGDILKE